ncbi:Cyclin-like F-box [Cordyceps fumosorosea ARSEF 2679]|uniref:Cyclin-like F-box n=1 Tax=Cordyceps fumosorosea (strain ARSEF 2679) TaxID=1081104 RepID=A0A167ND15_CORFA|nr:Cyclin-like F-box [Cordyceps fumosorosea ARSEF 2679]OAA55413.1 Cyclin-like F-box [Cordyceps fumosorosea ARSEF 2679]
MLVDSSEDESSSDGSEGGRLGPEEVEEEEEDASPGAMLRRLARAEVDKQTLRQTLFRYALYKSYFYDGEGEAPQLWVMHSAKWKYQL